MVNVSLVLFRDDRSGSNDAVAIVRNSIRRRARHYSLTEINVQDHPGLAAEYNVKTTPTILLVKNWRHRRPDCRHPDHIPRA
jgi:thioredoxin-like negative regulator of GroEL